VNRIANLIQSADKQRRLLWASLPFQTRMAELLFRIAFDPAETFGRMVYTVFLQRHVKGLPPVKGVPAETYDVTKAPGRMAPPGYGKDFGSKVWGSMVSKYKSQDIVQEAMQDVMFSLSSRPDRLEEGAPLSKAQGYVMTMVSNACLMAYRSRKRRPGDYGEDSPSGGGDDDAPRVDLADPDSLSEVVEWLNEESRGKIMPAIMRDLAKIPGAVPYVEAVLEHGYTDNEIVGDYRTGKPAKDPWFQEHPMTVQNFGTNIKPKIRKVFLKYEDMLRS